MDLHNKGIRNYKIAEMIYEESNKKGCGFFCSVVDDKKYLYSTVVNRLYYGLYMLAKGELVKKDCSVTEHTKIGHSGNNGIWKRLVMFYSEINNDLVLIDKIREARNLLDYQSDKNTTHDDFNNTKQISDKIFNILEKVAKDNI